jgi:hypothetical protein
MCQNQKSVLFPRDLKHVLVDMILTLAKGKTYRERENVPQLQEGA